MNNVIDLNDKPILRMMVGLPGSGKSYHANMYLSYLGDYIVCSSDELRKNMFGDESHQANNREVFDALHRQIIDNLIHGNNVIYDATNLTLKDRQIIINQIKQKNINCRICADVIATPIEKCLSNNSNRERKVPEDVIYKMVRKFQMPVSSEGFDWVEIGYPFKFDFYDKSYFIDKMEGFDQKNPHHTFDLAMHCQKCADYFYQRERDDLAEIALYHDIGKLYTQTFDENGNAHYYGHENYGAYLSLFIEHSLFNGYFTEVINYHMLPFQLKNASEKTINRYKSLLGECLWDNINEFHIGDIESR